MNVGKTLGFSMFLGGIFLLIVYGLYLGFEDLMSALDVISGLLSAVIILGVVLLIISIAIEQRHDRNATMKDIKKEDLKP